MQQRNLFFARGRLPAELLLGSQRWGGETSPYLRPHTAAWVQVGGFHGGFWPAQPLVRNPCRRQGNLAAAVSRGRGALGGGIPTASQVVLGSTVQALPTPRGLFASENFKPARSPAYFPLGRCFRRPRGVEVPDVLCDWG